MTPLLLKAALTVLIIFKLLPTIDMKPKQVLIEATIIVTKLTDASTLGINPSSITQDSSSTTSSPSESPFHFSIKSNHDTFTFPFSTTTTHDNSTVLANPKIRVTNHHTATINTGQETPYQTTTTTNTSTTQNVSFLSTGITLEITPHISEDNEILMDLSPSISESDTSGNLPSSSTTSSNTQVVVHNGETIIIGGLIRTKTSKIRSGIPVLSRIPLINLLFSEVKTLENREEITILITPHVIEDDSSETPHIHGPIRTHDDPS